MHKFFMDEWLADVQVKDTMIHSTAHTTGIKEPRQKMSFIIVTKVPKQTVIDLN